MFRFVLFCLLGINKNKTNRVFNKQNNIFVSVCFPAINKTNRTFLNKTKHCDPYKWINCTMMNPFLYTISAHSIALTYIHITFIYVNMCKTQEKCRLHLLNHNITSQNQLFEPQKVGFLSLNNVLIDYLTNSAYNMWNILLLNMSSITTPLGVWFLNL